MLHYWCHTKTEMTSFICYHFQLQTLAPNCGLHSLHLCWRLFQWAFEQVPKILQMNVKNHKYIKYSSKLFSAKLRNALDFISQSTNPYHFHRDWNENENENEQQSTRSIFLPLSAARLSAVKPCVPGMLTLAPFWMSSSAIFWWPKNDDAVLFKASFVHKYLMGF